jgi:sec-independent protein translocase protein TatC
MTSRLREQPPVDQADLGEAGGPRMSFLEHLDELRSRLLKIALAALLGLVASYAVADWILALLLDPIRDAMGQLAVIRPAEAFMNKVKAAFVGGLVLALPVLFYQLWAFIGPGLYPRERRWFVPVMMVGSLLFLAGAGFCYLVALPAAAGFLAEQGEQFNAQITVDSAFAFATKLLFGLGLVFELPLVIFALARLDLVTAGFLWKRIDIAVFICFLAAAILTPTPDAITMSLFALPMVTLYLISIGVAWLARPRRKP